MYSNEVQDQVKEEQSQTKSTEETLPADSQSFVTSSKRAKLSSNSTVDSEIEGQFSCQYCDKAFTKQSSLARHKYEHSGEDK